MRRKGLWLLVSAVIITAMLLTACKTEETTTTTAATTTAATTTTVTTITAPTTSTTTTVDMPKYGGTLNVCLTSDLSSFDSWATNPHSFARSIYDPLMEGDISLTESEWPAYGMYYPPNFLVGVLLESWEEVEVGTAIFHLRQGVHYANIAPVNGREYTADDTVYAINRARDPRGQIATSQSLKDIVVSVTALDKYTVEYKHNPAFALGSWQATVYKSAYWSIAREVVEKYGNLANPIGQVGTGPYMIRDYVPGSSFTCVRNPDYWLTDIRYPGNKLPYIDKIVTTVIPDVSTQLAALRTGKIDRLSAVPFDQASSLTTTNPDIRQRLMLAESSTYISPRNDLAPFSDVRVRRALSMGIDRHAIVDQFYKGYAQYSNYMCAEHWPEFIPLSEFSPEIQEIFEYNPDKARQLLADAGYPTGFNAEIIISSASRDGSEVMQLIKTWWADIGVDLELKVLDPASHSSIRYKHTFPSMALGGGGLGSPIGGFSYIYQPKGEFRTYATTEWANETYNEKYMAYKTSWDKSAEEQWVLWVDLVTYTRWMTPYIELPTVNNFLCWQSWLKGHWGQSALSFGVAGDFYKYMWFEK